MSERPLSRAHQAGHAAWDLEANREEDWQRLPRRQQVGIACGDLCYQIPRNTVQFWIHNGYAKLYQGRLQALLREIGTPTCLEVAGMVDEIWEIAGTIERLEEEYDDAVYDEEQDDWDEDNPGDPDGAATARAAISALVQRCSELDAAFLALVERYADDLDHYLESLDQAPSA